MRRTALIAALAAAVLSTTTASSVAAETDSDGSGRGLKVTGLTTDQRLVQFRVDRPGSIFSSQPVSGLQGGDTALVGIDYRVQDGLLYGVGNAGGIYTVNVSTAVATHVSQLGVALAGSAFGVDFNPAANRLRIISDTGQNLRHDVTVPVGGTVVDTVLTTPPSVAPALGVTGAAYTNNDLNPATATSLFDIDTANDRVVLQSPANAGLLVPTGDLGVNAGPSAGFDIYFFPKAGTNRGFAALQAGGTYRFYKISLLTGAATDRGAFPTNRQVFDVALPLNQK